MGKLFNQIIKMSGFLGFGLGLYAGFLTRDEYYFPS